MVRHGAIYLKAVDELGERDVLAVVEDVNCFESLVCAIAEPETEEVARVGRGPAAKLDGEGGAEVG